MFQYLTLVMSSIISILISATVVLSQDEACFRLQEVKVIPFDDIFHDVHDVHDVDVHDVDVKIKKELWPLNWIPPEHLRLDKYTYVSEESQKYLK